MNRSHLFLLAATVCSALLLAGCHGHEVHSPIPSGSQPFDQRFLVWLVNHHNDDDRMVNPCAKNETIRQELRDFCTTVDQQHRERVERMTAWLKDWYGENLPGTDNIPLWLGGLKGEQFEREFFKQYEHQHADAIEPMKQCSAKATHAELRELCQRIAPGQERQVGQLRQWRCQWFRECD
ncbi:MAG TPA: DUF305 domain-containing protein [Terriglobales bacterium]|nr:DUF305 domain-containing protein [Terriglobales bacterium]